MWSLFHEVLKVLSLGSHAVDFPDHLPLLVRLLSSLLNHVLSCTKLPWVFLDYSFFSFEGIQIWWVLVLAPDLNGTVPHVQDPKRCVQRNSPIVF